MITRETLRALIASRVESDMPDEVLHILQKHQGKAISVRLLAHMPGGADKWELQREHGMTHLMTKTYSRSRGNEGTSLLLAYTDKGGTVDTAFVTEKNTCHYAARVERNAKRMAVLNDAAMLDKCVAALNAYNNAREALVAAEHGVAYFTGYGQPFDADQYAIAELLK